MLDPVNTFDAPLCGLNEADWQNRLARITREHGKYEDLGRGHFSALIEDGTSLIVTFETVQGISALDENARPLGWEIVKTLGWSHLALVSDGDTWFRDENVFEYVDGLVDDGVFDRFDDVLFYGAGPCGYAAAAFSVAAPGATVVAIQPQATLTPEIASWDDRFVEDRWRDFTTRYGYAPDMIDACRQCFVIYDPLVPLDAMHAALFTRPNVTKLPVRRMGTAIQTGMMEMQVLLPLLVQAGSAELSRSGFARLMRARRSYAPYLGKVLLALETDGRHHLAERMCRNVTARVNVPKLARRLEEMDRRKG